MAMVIIAPEMLKLVIDTDKGVAIQGSMSKAALFSKKYAEELFNHTEDVDRRPYKYSWNEEKDSTKND